MKNEKLMRAIGQIDEDLILEARQAVRPRRKYVRWAALAACLALVLLASPVVLLGTMGAGGAAKEEADMEMEVDNCSKYEGENWLDEIFNTVISSSSSQLQPPNAEGMFSEDGKAFDSAETPDIIPLVYPKGNAVERPEGTLILTEMTDSTVRFRWIAKTECSLIIKPFLRCKDPNKGYGYQDSMLPPLTVVYVNGVRAHELPQAPGEYDIVLDFTKVLEAHDLILVRYIGVNGFGLFSGD